MALAVCSFLICLALTPLCRDLFHRLGLVDRPDAERKFHLREVPRIGGLPIVMSYAAALGLMLIFHPGHERLYIQHKHLFTQLLPAAGIIFLTGLIDDIFGLKPWQKLTGQMLAAGLALSLGARVVFPHLPPWASLLFSLVWLVGCTNAFNLIDGMDGLATGISLIASFTTAVVALLTGNTGLALATVPLTGCLLAFLIYNFNPASIFLGDCGSLTIGFLLGCFSLIWSQHTTSILGMAAPLMALALPLLDVLLAITRRFLRRVPIFQGDRGHIHHMILGLGFSTRATTLILYAVCGLSASLAVLDTFIRIGLGWPILVLFVVLVLVGIDQLGYVEWSAMRRLLSRINMRQAMQDEIYLVELRRAVVQAESPEMCWQVVRNVCHDFNFTSARMEFAGKTFSEQFVESTGEPTNRLQLHLGARDYLVLTRPFRSETPKTLSAALDLFQIYASDKAAALEHEEKPLSSHAA